VRAAKAFASALFFILFAAVAVEAGAEEGLDAFFEATMTDIYGKPMTLSHFRDRPLIVNFWARACVACRDEFPVFAALRTKYKKRGLTVLGIALEEDPAKVREFLTVYKANYPVALAGGQEGIALMQGLGNDESLLPFTLLINRKGKAILRKYGLFRKSDFQAVAEELLR
jgi:thiol-disulfide isomerase/thioredoxin